MKADCHMHMLLDGVDWKAAIRRHKEAPHMPTIRAALAAYQAQGCTYLRDGGDRWGVGAAARGIALEYGIRYRTPLAPLCRAGHYGGFIGEVYENMGEFRDLVAKTRKNNGDFIKIMISGLMDFDRFGVLTEEGLPPAQIRELIHIAHEEGFTVMAHCNGARTMEAAASAGADSIEHGAYADRDALAAMAENRTIWVPTVSTVANLRGTGRFDEKAVAAIWEHLQENLRQYAAMGGLIAPGSDAGAWAVPHGANTEDALLGQFLDPTLLEQGTAAIMARF